MENVNCLAGKTCPRCGSEGPFGVVGVSRFLLSDDGTDEFYDVEFDESSPADCPSCDYSGKWADFDVR